MNIQVLDQQFNIVYVLDSFESVIWTDRFKVCGDFEVVTFMASTMSEYLKKGYYLVSNESEHAMIIEEREIETDVEEGDTLIIKGRSLESILDRRIIWELITFEKENLQTALYRLINESIMFESIALDPIRHIPNFKFKLSTDTAITELLITNQYLGNNLYDIVTDQCTANKIGFKIILTADNFFEFSLYAGVDRSYLQTDNPYIIFSPGYDNLLNSKYNESTKAYKNAALIRGDKGTTINDSTNVVSLRIDESVGIDRREIYTDASSISSVTSTSAGSIYVEDYPKLLNDQGVLDLSKCIETSSFEGETDTTYNFTYGIDYSMGDIVELQSEYEIESVVQITELIISESTEGQTKIPTFSRIDNKEEDT